MSVYWSASRCTCARVITVSGQMIQWASEIRYLGVYIIRSRVFKCSVDIAKWSFYSVDNAVFCKIGRLTPKDVILQLIKQMYAYSIVLVRSMPFN